MKIDDEPETLRTQRIADRIVLAVIAAAVAAITWVVTPPQDDAGAVAWVAPEQVARVEP